MSYFIASEADASKITYDKSEGDGPGTITIPKNVFVDTLTVKNGAHVQVDGNLNELTGNPGIVDGQGVINTIRGADCYSIEGNLYVTLIDKSKVKWCVACGTVEEIRGSTIADAINWSPGSRQRRFFLCRIKQEDAVFIDEGRVKAPRARVIVEVDGRGCPLEPVD
jgi:hypothetical protein|nr:MAG TPA: hypothetical protein [Caudoviricetes sp.]